MRELESDMAELRRHKNATQSELEKLRAEGGTLRGGPGSTQRTYTTCCNWCLGCAVVLLLLLLLLWVAGALSVGATGKCQTVALG